MKISEVMQSFEVVSSRDRQGGDGRKGPSLVCMFCNRAYIAGEEGAQIPEVIPSRLGDVQRHLASCVFRKKSLLDAPPAQEMNGSSVGSAAPAADADRPQGVRPPPPKRMRTANNAAESPVVVDRSTLVINPVTSTLASTQPFAHVPLTMPQPPPLPVVPAPLAVPSPLHASRPVLLPTAATMGQNPPRPPETVPAAVTLAGQPHLPQAPSFVAQPLASPTPSAPRPPPQNSERPSSASSTRPNPPPPASNAHQLGEQLLHVLTAATAEHIQPVSSLADFSSPNAPRVDLPATPVSLQPLLQDVLVLDGDFFGPPPPSQLAASTPGTFGNASVTNGPRRQSPSPPPAPESMERIGSPRAKKVTTLTTSRQQLQQSAASFSRLIVNGWIDSKLGVDSLGVLVSRTVAEGGTSVETVTWTDQTDAVELARNLERVLVKTHADRKTGQGVTSCCVGETGQRARTRRILARRWPHVMFPMCQSNKVNTLMKILMSSPATADSMRKGAALTFFLRKGSSTTWLERLKNIVSHMYPPEAEDSEKFATRVVDFRFESIHACLTSLLRIETALRLLADDFTTRIRGDQERVGEDLGSRALCEAKDDDFWNKVKRAERFVRPVAEAALVLEHDGHTIAHAFHLLARLFWAYRGAGRYHGHEFNALIRLQMDGIGLSASTSHQSHLTPLTSTLTRLHCISEHRIYP